MAGRQAQRQAGRCACACAVPSARKEKIHCSTAAVCSLRRSGMFSGANSIFMRAFGLLGAARSLGLPRSLGRFSGLALPAPPPSSPLVRRRAGAREQI